MPTPKIKTSAAGSLAVISTVLLTSFVMALHHLARDIIIPLALAALLTFLLAHLLQQQGCEASSAPGKLVADDLLGLVQQADACAACI